MRREQGEGSPAQAHVVYVAPCLRVAYICYVTVVMQKKRGKVYWDMARLKASLTCL